MNIKKLSPEIRANCAYLVKDCDGNYHTCATPDNGKTWYLWYNSSIDKTLMDRKVVDIYDIHNFHGD